MRSVEVDPAVKDLIDVTQIEAANLKFANEYRTFTVKIRVLNTQKEVGNVLSTIDMTNVILLQKAINVNTFVPYIVFMVKDSKNTLMHQFYQADMILMPKDFLNYKEEVKKLSFWDKLKALWS